MPSAHYSTTVVFVLSLSGSPGFSRTSLRLRPLGVELQAADGIDELPALRITSKFGT